MWQRTQTREHWERAVRLELARRLGGLIDAYRLSLIDVFAEPPWDALTESHVYPLTLRQRLGWMFKLSRSGVETSHGLALSSTDGSLARYRHFCFRDATSDRGCFWVWHIFDLNDFVMHHGDYEKILSCDSNWTIPTLVSIGVFLLHPTTRLVIKRRDKVPIYVIDCPKTMRTWRGPARYHMDMSSGVGTMVPRDDCVGSWTEMKE